MDPHASPPPLLRLERVFEATPEKLWAYWTEPRRFARWFNPAPDHGIVVHEWDLRPGGRIRFDMPQPGGHPNPQEGVFHTLRPHEELVTGSQDKSFLLRVRFEPVGPRRTRMVLEVTGVPPPYHAGAIAGWNAGLDKLEGELRSEAAPAGRAEGFTIERVFRAPPEKVWRMWTTAPGLERWFRPEGYTTRVTRLDVRPGGGYACEMTSKEHTVVNHGTYMEVQPPRRLAMVWRFDIFLGPDDKPYDVPITVELHPTPDGGTRMVFTQGPLATPEYTEGSRQGVLSNFRQLDEALGA